MTRIRTALAVALLAALAAQSARAGAAGTSAVPAGARDILNTNSYWRWQLYLKKPTVSVAELKAAGQNASAPVPLTGRELIAPYTRVDRVNSPLPPAGWQKAGYDDAHWPRSRPVWFRGQAFGRFSAMSVRLRGKFSVTNPAAAGGLYLTMKYFGGAVVYLNGKEVARAHLPEGKLEVDTLAVPYPKEAQVDEKGVPIPRARFRRGLPAALKKKLEGLETRRWRKLGPVRLPASALKRGVNVLAIEIRRSHYPAVALKWFSGKVGRTQPSWKPIYLAELKLQAAGAGVTASVARPKGFQVWNEDRNVRLCLMDFGNPNEKLMPVRLTGARNGTFCGQVAVGSTAPIRGLNVRVGELKAVKGGGSIPAAGVTALFGRADVAFYGMPPWFDALAKKPPAEVPVHKRYKGALLPVVIRVRVPADAKPGDYRGRMVVSAAGARAVTVPIELHVADWVVPQPRDYRTYVGIYQSPTTVALQYGVEMWSEKHWKLLEKSFGLLARAGNKMVNIPVVDQTQFGNDQGFIRWIKKADGGCEYDFKDFDRYMALVKKHCGVQDYVALQIWHAGGWKHRGAEQKNTVTVVEEKTGARSRMQVPKFDSPEARKFWKPVLDALRARLAKLGMEKALCVGILSDSTAPPEVFKMFDEVMPPSAKWHRGCHTQNRSPKPYRANRGGGTVVLHEHCYGLVMADPEKKLPPFWNLRGKPATAYDRISNHERYMSLAWYRNTAMLSLFRQTQGVGRVCLDFWPVLKGGRGKVWVYNRYPHSSCAQRRPSMQKMTWPGPDGAATTIRYEAFLEGIQDSEAVVCLSRALDRDSARLGTGLADECRAALAGMMRYQYYGRERAPLRPNHYGWQELSAGLYSCAAKVRKKLGR